MRRKDREITIFHEIIGILGRCPVLRVGIFDQDAPYIIPVNFGFHSNGEVLTIYFHSAKAGRKVDLLAANPKVCFEADRLVRVVRGDIACNWTAAYESVIGYGAASAITALDEKKFAMDCIMKHCGFEGTPHYDEAVFARTLLYKIEVHEISGKANNA